MVSRTEKVTEKIIVLKTTRYGDVDLVVHGLNSQGSKLTFFAKSALKSKRRFGGGVLEPTHYLRVDYVESRRNGSMHSLQEASLVESFSGLRGDYDRLQAGLHFVHLIDRLSREGTLDSAPLFHLLGNSLKAAETTKDILNLKLHFEVKLLGFHGTLPPTEAAEKLMHLPISEHDRLPLSTIEKKKARSYVDQALASL